jgi:hypothetical protein
MHPRPERAPNHREENVMRSMKTSCGLAAALLLACAASSANAQVGRT